jgi:hypothetical protein
MRVALLAFLVATLALAARIAGAGDAAPPEQTPAAPFEGTPSSNPSGDTAPPDRTTPCVDVEIGGDRSQYFNCLNEQLKRGADQEHKIEQPTAPLDARSPSNKVGTANDAAARQRMGNAFGKSATPQRPNPTYVNPLLQNAP